MFPVKTLVGDLYLRPLQTGTFLELLNLKRGLAMLKTWIKRSFIVGMGFCLLAPVVSHAYGEAEVIQKYVGSNSLVPLIKPSWGNFILHTETLNQLYAQRGYRAVWVDSNGSPTAMAQALKNILLTADRHGLNASDYWDSDVENLFKAAMANPRNWITFELAASEALIRYVTHLSKGRFDPMQIDDDIKYPAKKFEEYALLNTAIDYGPNSMGPALDDNFAPIYLNYYSDLMWMLEKLRKVKAQGGWPKIPQASVDLKLNVKNPLVVTLRSRLKEWGYGVNNLTSDIYDAEFQAVVKEFQEYNGLFMDGVVSAGSSGVIKALNESPDYRINQIVVNMEKLRWLPRNIPARHLFANLATAEVRVYDESGTEKLMFNSVVGQPFRRTPSMPDKITYVNLNPYWTAPRSILVKDKLPLLRNQGSSYLEKNNMDLIDEETGTVLTNQDLNGINWSSINPKNFGYVIRQRPSEKNALGLVKFPLQNDWAIYLHDTNEPEHFRRTDQVRHRSSGCVRMEQAYNLALLLLDGQPVRYYRGKEVITKITFPINDWYEIQRTGKREKEYTVWNDELLKKVLDKGSAGERRLWDLSANVKHMPVYTLYLSSHMNGTKFRFVEDPYGQDKRIELAIKNYRAKGELF